MTIELKRKKLELIRIDAAYAELEFTIEERMADIERIEKHKVLNRETKVKIQAEVERLSQQLGE